ncbi:MAG TPA: hypothetical protein DEP27_00335 [Ruminococcaceae bacterium]|nr:hypothetical protein [Oscillospiraceae bacterium]
MPYKSKQKDLHIFFYLENTEQALLFCMFNVYSMLYNNIKNSISNSMDIIISQETVVNQVAEPS